MPQHDVVYASLWGATLPTTRQSAIVGTTIGTYHLVTLLESGYVIGMRYAYNGTANRPFVGYLRNPTNNQILRTCVFKANNAPLTDPPKWQHAYFHPRLPYTVNQQVIMWVEFPANGWWYNPAGLATAGVSNAHMSIARDNPLGTTSWISSAGSQSTSKTARNGDWFGVDLLLLV